MSVAIEHELKTMCKINRFLEENQLSSFSDVEEVDECLEKMREVLQENEDVHIELRREIGDEEHEKSTDFESSRDMMMTWLKMQKASNQNSKKFLQIEFLTA